MIPLTETLFVSAALEAVDKVMVDVGAGYFVNMTIAKAKEFLHRKATFVKTNADSLDKVLAAKKENVDAVMSMQRQRQQEGIRA